MPRRKNSAELYEILRRIASEKDTGTATRSQSWFSHFKTLGRGTPPAPAVSKQEVAEENRPADPGPSSVRVQKVVRKSAAEQERDRHLESERRSPLSGGTAPEHASAPPRRDAFLGFRSILSPRRSRGAHGDGEGLHAPETAATSGREGAGGTADSPASRLEPSGLPVESLVGPPEETRTEEATLVGPAPDEGVTRGDPVRLTDASAAIDAEDAAPLEARILERPERPTRGGFLTPHERGGGEAVSIPPGEGPEDADSTREQMKKTSPERGDAEARSAATAAGEADHQKGEGDATVEGGSRSHGRGRKGTSGEARSRAGRGGRKLRKKRAAARAEPRAPDAAAPAPQPPVEPATGAVESPAPPPEKEEPTPPRPPKESPEAREARAESVVGEDESAGTAGKEPVPLEEPAFPGGEATEPPVDPPGAEPPVVPPAPEAQLTLQVAAPGRHPPGAASRFLETLLGDELVRGLHKPLEVRIGTLLVTLVVTGIITMIAVLYVERAVQRADSGDPPGAISGIDAPPLERAPAAEDFVASSPPLPEEFTAIGEPAGEAADPLEDFDALLPGIIEPDPRPLPEIRNVTTGAVADPRRFVPAGDTPGGAWFIQVHAMLREPLFLDMADHLEGLRFTNICRAPMRRRDETVYYLFLGPYGSQAEAEAQKSAVMRRYRHTPLEKVGAPPHIDDAFVRQPGAEIRRQLERYRGSGRTS